MLNRRHLRIKVLQALYAYFQSDGDDVLASEKEMMKAIDRIHDLYLYLLLSFSELKHIAEHRIEENKKKIVPKEEDLHPNLKFVHNQIIQQLESSAELRKKSEQHKVSWLGDQHRELFRKMFVELKESETYFEYMNNGVSGFEEDKAFAIALFKSEIANFPLLYTYFEDKSIHWLDDIDLVCQMVIKTIKTMQPDDKVELLPLYKDQTDEQEFVSELFRKTISMHRENEVLIDELTKNWELERIAKMDIILMQMAITEMLIFSNIPTKVTLNEYIEISKFYSTPKSNGFINGVLDKAILKLSKEGKLKKVGRGLME